MERTTWIALVLVIAGTSALPKPRRLYIGEVDIEEEGVKFVEQVSVEDDIVHISVPQHRDVMASDVIMDLAQNTSVRYVPAVHRCFMEPSVQIHGNPGHEIRIEADFTRWPVQSKAAALTVSHQWTPGFRIAPHSLPEHISVLCGHAPLYLLLPLHQKRDKRQVSRCISPNQLCSLTTKACHYIPVRDCSRRHLVEKFGEILTDKEEDLIRCSNGQAHFIDKVMCCAPCCEDRDTADASHPYCLDVFPECGETEEISYADAVQFTREMRRQEEEEEDRRREEEDRRRGEEEPRREEEERRREEEERRREEEERRREEEERRREEEERRREEEERRREAEERRREEEERRREVEERRREEEKRRRQEEEADLQTSTLETGNMKSDEDYEDYEDYYDTATDKPLPILA